MHDRSWIHIHPRLNDDGSIKMEWRQYVVHLAGVPNKSKGQDRFLFSAAKEKLGEKAWQQFKKNFLEVMRYMAEVNKFAEKTGVKTFKPFLVVIERNGK